jgi:uncharacterized protein (DUF885 family)
LLVISFNPGFFAKAAMKQGVKDLATPATNSLDKFLDNEIIDSALKSPESLTNFGLDDLDFLTNHNEKWDDYSIKANEDAYEDFLEYERRLNSFDANSLQRSAKLNLMVAKFSAENQKRQFESFEYHQGPFIQFYGSHLGFVDFMTDTHRIGDQKDAEDYIKRVYGISKAINELMEVEKLRANRGLFSPGFVYERSLVQLEILTSTDTLNHPLYSSFKNKIAEISIDEAQADDLLKNLEVAINESFKPTYTELTELIRLHSQDAREHDGVWSMPNGEDYYKHRLKIYTTTDYSPDEIHEIGLKLVESIQSEIRSILEAEGYDISRPLATLYDELNNDPRFLFEDSDAGRQAILDEYTRIQNETYKILPQYFNELPIAEVIVKRVPVFAEKSAAGGYYRGPSLDGSRPGVWYANLYDINATQTFKMPALSFHEAVPGHHMQIALNQENPNQTLWNKFGYRTSAYSEGWALYAERLAIEAGLINDPFEMIGSLQSELFRAARLVIDTGLHAKKWTREEAIVYMMDNVGEVRSEAQSEIERYIVWPGQATSYMIGRVKILELRERAKKELGNRFDIKDFHSAVLMNGILPLTVLEAVVDDYIIENS